jgi:hypothetical protein
MTRDEFAVALRSKTPPAGGGPLAQALWHDANGDWDGAHRLAQGVEGAQAALLHAYLHRKEGDAANALYWYRRAGAAAPSMSLQDEWESLVEAVFSGNRA